MRSAVGVGGESDEESPMQDLFQNYMDDVSKLREAFHSELTATAEELTKAMGLYAARSEAALASFMEKASTRGAELETAAAVRFNQFRGLPANTGLPDVDDGPLARTPTNADNVRITTAAEKAIVDGLQVERDGDRKPPQLRSIALIKSGSVQSEPAA
jgi:hypothetical protein